MSGPKTQRDKTPGNVPRVRDSVLVLSVRRTEYVVG